MLDADEQLQHALALAYEHLSRRERTVSDMRAHLERQRVPARVLAQAMQTLTEHGAVDDARFARLFAQDKRELEDWGSERIRRGLLARGVDCDLIDEVLDDSSERDRALALLSRRFPSPPADRRERERALGVLLRKGYDSEVALEALAAYARAVGASEQ